MLRIFIKNNHKHKKEKLIFFYCVLCVCSWAYFTSRNWQEISTSLRTRVQPLRESSFNMTGGGGVEDIETRSLKFSQPPSLVVQFFRSPSSCWFWSIQIVGTLPNFFRALSGWVKILEPPFNIFINPIDILNELSLSTTLFQISCLPVTRTVHAYLCISMLLACNMSISLNYTEKHPAQHF